jgi:transcriptional regulator with XRE-family HTH domain
MVRLARDSTLPMLMGAPKRPQLIAEARRRNLELLAALGAEIRASRHRRHLSQRGLGEQVGLAQTTISLLERGHGGRLSLDTWQRLSLALGRSARLALGVDAIGEPADAGHLAIQELVLRSAKANGVTRTFELATRPADPSRSADVGLRDDRRGVLMLVECWNSIGDIGAAVRSSDRKRAEATTLAVATGPIGVDGVASPYRVALCWVVRATARNRALLARYPEVFATRFPGSSVAWTNALTRGAEPPEQPGLAWTNLASTRLIPWRRRPRS